MRASKTLLTAAAACAFALLPAATAVAGSGPDPSPGQRQSTSTAPSPAGNPLSTKAKAAGVCEDAHQIGESAYIDREGRTIGSVKQFYSEECQENYAYLWVWQDFIDSHDDYDVSVGIYSYDQDAIVGGRSWTDSNGQEFWSDPAATVDECTAAHGSIRAVGDPAPSQATTAKRC